MSEEMRCWLVRNPQSGSNSEDAVAELEACCARNGIDIAGRTRFPEEVLPSPKTLDAARVRIVVIFAGDGTANALISALDGWDGVILTLPGGTMNLIARRLHGDRSFAAIISELAAGRAWTVRPTVIRSAHGIAIAGLLAGPGTSWNKVREAMRDIDAIAIADGAAKALALSTNGVTVRCAEPAVGRKDGYPLLMLIPHDGRIELIAYRSETLAEYARQGLALLKRDFREGPHTHLGLFETLTLESVEDRPVRMLIDGEPAKGARRETYAAARCGVDLVATAHDC